MNADLELQVALVGRILGKKPEQVIEDAIRLHCRSIAGGAKHLAGTGAVATDSAAAKAAKRAVDSPGSLEGRLVAFVKKHGTAKPGTLAAELKIERPRVTRLIRLLDAAGVLRVTGATMSRRVGLV